jgi:hypothetical protein
MIKFLRPSDLESYRRVLHDPLLAYLGDPRAMGLTSETWLLGSDARRMVAWTAYEPLLRSEGLKVLDVGAGFSSLSFLLSERHDYLVAELCVHDEPPEGIRTFRGDWYDLTEDEYDIVLAVDIFPNADQRLATFLSRYAGKLRMILTTYPERWYRVQRLDAEEQLTIRAWDWDQTERVLKQYADAPAGSLFPNGRQVALVTA